MNTLKLNDQEIHSLTELREKADLTKLTPVFLDGTLEEWLSACYYEREADAVSRLEHVLSPAVEQKMCLILGIKQSMQGYMTPEQKAVYNQKCTAVRRYSTDESLLNHVLETATNQAELAELLDSGCKTIYLCEGPFSVPIRKSGVHYIGIGSPVMEAPFTEEQYRRAGITFAHISLPQDSDQEVSAIAESAAEAHGYDGFEEKHTRLASAFHFGMKCQRLSHYCHIDADMTPAGEFYKSKRAAEKAAHTVIENAYAQANSYFDTERIGCIAPGLAAEYAQVLTNGAMKLAERLKPFCANEESRRIRLANLLGYIIQADRNLTKAFEKELDANADYYRMYEKSYFLERVEIEKNDYNLDLFDSDLMNGLARLIHDDSEYTVENLYETVSELEEDVNKHADAFYGCAYQEYKDYCKEIEKIAEEIGKDLSDDDLIKLGIWSAGESA